MRTVEQLKQEIQALEAKHKQERTPLESALYDVYVNRFEACPALQDAIKEAETSTDFTIDEYGMLSTWTRVDLTPECIEVLQKYLTKLKIEHLIYMCHRTN